MARTHKERAPDTPGARLTTARLAAGLTQQQVAKRADLHRTDIAAIEGGHRGMPSPAVAIKLADALGFTLDWFYCRTEEGGPTPSTGAEL